MKTRLAFAFGLLLPACAAPAPAPVPEASTLVGRWKVDLRPTPDAEPYFQTFVVERVEQKTFAGSFYGAAVADARINTDWGAIRIAFTTADGSGAYHHSAVLRDGRLEGLTNSTGRAFLAYWSATKE